MRESVSLCVRERESVSESVRKSARDARFSITKHTVHMCANIPPLLHTGLLVSYEASNLLSFPPIGHCKDGIP